MRSALNLKSFEIHNDLPYSEKIHYHMAEKLGFRFYWRSPQSLAIRGSARDVILVIIGIRSNTC